MFMQFRRTYGRERAELLLLLLSIQYCPRTVQYSTVQYSTVLQYYSTVQYSTVFYKGRGTCRMTINRVATITTVLIT